jgi:hypothetical protein
MDEPLFTLPRNYSVRLTPNLTVRLNTSACSVLGLLPES